jgi:hypothetical protein
MTKKSKFHADGCKLPRMNFSDPMYRNLVGIHAMISNPFTNFTT